jgi:hypothetical protein
MIIPILILFGMFVTRMTECPAGVQSKARSDALHEALAGPEAVQGGEPVLKGRDQG